MADDVLNRCEYRHYDDIQCANDAHRDGRCRPHQDDKLEQVKALCNHALAVLEGDGEYHAEDLADQILAIIASCDIFGPYRRIP